VSSRPGGDDRRYRRLSYWMDSLGESLVARPALGGNLEVDVAIVGGGYTGLWTAYYLACHEPSLRIAVLEAEIAGYGASGRNGGWCSALFAVSDARLAREFGRSSMLAMRKEMRATVDEVGKVAASEGIECHFRKAGTVSAARSRAQEATLRAELAEARELGVGEEDLYWVGADEARSLMNATDVVGALVTPHCAAIHPARLVRGLARSVERLGVQLYETTRVTEVVGGEPGRHPVLHAPGGRVRAETVVVATEGYTARLPGRSRDVAPIYSLMVATERLGSGSGPADLSGVVGSALANGATFTDGRHLLIYGQLTADGRLAFGGRGAPYHYNSKVAESFERVPRVHGQLRAAIVELFPALSEVAITHHWGGPIGVHRDWFPSVTYDRETGLASAGGYVGDGVATTNLAGRTLADLILGRDTELVTLPWVGHGSPRWEPEPWRWIGINAGLRAMALSDALESRTGRPSWVASSLNRLLGG